MGHQAVLCAFLLQTANVLSVLSLFRHRAVYSTSPLPRGQQIYIERAACTIPGVVRSICCSPLEITSPTTTTFSSTRTTQSTTETLINFRIGPINAEPTPGTVLNWSLLPSDKCGAGAGNRIANGNKTRPFDYPWMVVLRYNVKEELKDGCGGSLINNRYVLSAAHCVKTTRNSKLVRVRLGEHDKASPIDCIVYQDGETECAPEAYDVDIEETIVHKSFHYPIAFRHDIALIRLAREVEFSDSVQPICLPVDESVRDSVPSRYVVAGWGMTENGAVSEVLLEAFVNHMPMRECQRALSVGLELADPWQVCAKGEGMAGTCGGDSGGPLVSIVAITGSPKFVQFGIVCAGVASCGPRAAPGLFTRVSAYMDWIVANMRP